MKLPFSKRILRRAGRYILGSSIVVLVAAPVVQGAVNSFTHGFSTSWANPANWSLGHTPASAESPWVSTPAGDSTLDGNFNVQTLSFDTGAASFGIDANASGTTARTFSFTGGAMDALGGPDVMATSATTTGTITFGGLAGRGTLTVDFGNVNGTINIAHAAAKMVFGANATIAGTAGLTKNGAGTLTLAGANSFTGETKINDGILSLAHVNALAGGGTIAFGGGTLQYTSANTVDYSARLSMAPGQVYRIDTNGQTVNFGTPLTGVGSTLIKLGTGTLKLNSFGTTIAIAAEAGVLDVSHHTGAITTGNLAINGGALDYGSRTSVSVGGLSGSGTLVLTNSLSQSVSFTVDSSSIVSTTFSGTLSGTGFLIKNGTSTLVLSGDNSGFGSGINLNGGTLRLGHANAAAGSTVGVGANLSFGTLASANIGGLSGGAGVVTQNEAGEPVAVSVGANNQNTTFTGAITGSGSLIKTGTGRLTLNGSGSTAAITLVAGTLGVNNIPNALGTGVFTINGGALDFGSLTSPSAGGLAGSGNLVLTAAGNQPVFFSVGSNNLSTTFSGTISGHGSSLLIKTGTGILTLSGDNSGFAGGFSISAGTLRLGHVNAVAGSTVGAGSGLSFGDLTAVNLGGIAGSLGLVTQNEIGAAAAVSVGGNGQNTTYTGAITGTGSLIKVGAGTLTLGNNTSTAAITLNAGTLSFGGGSGLGTGVFTINGGAVNYGSMTFATVGALAGSGNLVLTNSNNQPVSLNVGGNNLSTTFSGTLSGLGSLTKSGSGTWTLSGDNSGFTGGLSMAGGTLLLASSNAAAGPTVFFGGGNLSFGSLMSVTLGGISGSSATTLFTNNSHGAPVTVSVGANGQNTTFSGTLAGTGTLVKVGTGTLTLSNANSATTAAITLSAGTLVPGNPNALGSGIFTINGGAFNYGTLPSLTVGALAGAGNLVLTNSNNQPVFFSAGGNNISTTFSGTLSGLGTLNKTGGGTLTLSGDNSGFTGGITFSAGTVLLANPNAAAGATVSFNGGSLSFGNLTSATLGGLIGSASLFTSNALGLPVAVSVGANSQSTTFSGALLGAGSLIKVGAGTLTLSSTSSTAAITLSAGTLAPANPNALGNGIFTINGGSINFNTLPSVTVGALAGSGNLVLTNSSNQAVFLNAGSNGLSTTYSGSLSGLGSVSKTGSGTLTLSGDNSGYSGGIGIFSGTLLLANPNAAAGSTVTLGGGSLSFGNLTSATLGGLTSSTAGTPLVLQNAVGVAVKLTVGANGQSTTWIGALSGPGSLIKAGAGTLTFTTGNSYSGGTNIVGGTALLTNSSVSALGTGAVQVGRFGTLTGVGLVAGAATIDGILAPGNTVGVLNFGSTLAFSSTALYQVEVADFGNDSISASGQITLGGSLQISLVGGFTPVVSQKFYIVLDAPGVPITGTFANVTPVTSTTGTLIASGALFQVNYADSLAGGQNAVSITYVGSATGSTPATSIYTWTGTGADTNWSSVGNWQGGAAPANDSVNTVLVFSGSGTGAFLTPNNTVANFGVTGIFFGPGSGNFVMSGQSLNLGAGGVNSSRVGAQTISNNIALQSSQSWRVDAGGALVVSGNISGAASLTKNGGGLLQLTGANSYSGGTNLNDGALNVGSAGALGSIGTIFFGGGTLQFSAANTTDYSPRFSTAAGQLYRIDTNGQSVAFGSALTSTGGVLTKLGEGVLTLNGTNTYSGGTNLLGGVLRAGSAGALGTTGSIFFGGGTLQFSATNTTDYSSRFSAASNQAYSFDTNGESVTFASNMTSSASTLTKLGAGSLTLSGQNDFAGGINLNGGNLVLGSVAALGNSGPISFGGGTLQFTGSNLIDYSNRFSTAAGQAYVIDTGSQTVLFLSPLVSAGGSLTKLGTGTLRLANSGSTMTIVVQEGTLDVGNFQSAAGTGNVTLNGGAIGFRNLTTSFIGSLSGAGNLVLINGNNQAVMLDAGGNNLPTTFSGTISGFSNSRLNKSGAGTLTLTGDNSGFNGIVSISGGTLLLGSANAASGPTVNPNGGVLSFGTFTAITLGNYVGTDLTTQNDLGQAVAVSVGSNNQNVSYFGAITGPGEFVKIGSGTFTLGNPSSTARITLNAGTLALNNVNALGSGTFTINGGALAFGNGTVVAAGGLAGSGTLTLTNANNQSVQFTVGSNNFSTTFSGSLAGIGSLIKAGDGNLTLAGDNSGYAGGIVINAGVLTLANANAVAGSTVSVGASGLLSFGTLTAATFGGVVGSFTLMTQNEAGQPVAVSVGANNQNTTFSGAVTGPGGLIKIGTGTLQLAGSASTAPITLMAGVLNIANLPTAALGTGIFTINGGLLFFGNSTVGTAGGLAGSGTLTLTNGNNQQVAFTVGSNNLSTTFSGTLAGLGGLTKTGTGTLTLSGDNSGLGGGMTLFSGTLRLAHPDAAAGSTIFFNGGALSFGSVTAVTLGGLAGSSTDYPLLTQNEAGQPVAVSVGANNQNTTFSGVVLGAGSLIKTGSGRLTLTNSNSTSSIVLMAGSIDFGFNPSGLGQGNLVINGGSLFYGPLSSVTVGGLAGSGNLGLTNSNNSAVTFNVGGNNYSTVFSGTLSGLGSLVKNGSGTLTLSGDNSGFTRGIGIGSGVLQLANVNAVSGATVFFNGGALSFGTLTAATLGNISGSASSLALQNDAGAPVAVSVGANNTDQNFGGGISGPGSFTKIGTGTLTLSGAGAYTGGTNLNGGSLTPNLPNAFGSGLVTFGGGTLRYASMNADLSAQFSTAPNQPFSISVTSAPVSFNSPLVSLGGSLTKTGPGQLALNAVNTYTGPTTVSAGTLVVNAVNGIAATSAVTVDAGASLSINTAAIGSLAGAGSVFLFNSSTLNTGNDNTSTTFSGSISNNGGLTKSGTGTFTLSGTNTYGGATKVDRGTLIVSGAISGTTSVTVGDGVDPARLGGTGTIATVSGGAVTVKDGATLAPGIGSASGLSINAAFGTASLNFQGGSKLELSMANSQAGAGAPSLNDYAHLTLGTGVSATLTGGTIVTNFDGLLSNGDLFTIILSGAPVTGRFANTLTAAPNSAGSTYRFTSNGLVWDINYAWTGAVPLSGIDPFAFEQTTGGTNVALLLVTVPEPGAMTSLLAGCGVLLGWRRWRRSGRASL